MHTAEPMLYGPSSFEAKFANETLKRYKLQGVDQMPADRIKARSKTLRSEIHKLINSV
jgi:hypothetical protein